MDVVPVMFVMMSVVGFGGGYKESKNGNDQSKEFHVMHPVPQLGPETYRAGSGASTGRGKAGSTVCQ